ncbi:MAG: DUF896 domain-containing protein [Desulfitobacteriaceae bacterium]
MDKIPINQLIARINELTKKQRAEGLEEWEKAERESLRQEYLSFIRDQVVQSLNQTRTENKPIH